MNIDIVNKQVAKKLEIKEADVKLINNFYWGSIKEHLYNYDPQPLNIDGICVLHPEKKLVKKAILKYIHRIRTIRKSKKFRSGSAKSKAYIERYKLYVKDFYNLRKYHKFTN